MDESASEQWLETPTEVVPQGWGGNISQETEELILEYGQLITSKLGKNDEEFACGAASEVWATLFILKLGLATLIEGMYEGEEEEEELHTWLELLNGGLFDPTAGQFSKPVEVDNYEEQECFDCYDLADLEWWPGSRGGYEC